MAYYQRRSPSPTTTTTVRTTTPIASKSENESGSSSSGSGLNPNKQNGPHSSFSVSMIPAPPGVAAIRSSSSAVSGTTASSSSYKTAPLYPSPTASGSRSSSSSTSSYSLTTGGGVSGIGSSPVFIPSSPPSSVHTIHAASTNGNITGSTNVSLHHDYTASTSTSSPPTNSIPKTKENNTVNPLYAHAIAASSSSKNNMTPQEIHIVKVTHDTVQIESGPIQSPYLNKVEKAVRRRFNSPSVGAPLDEAGIDHNSNTDVDMKKETEGLRMKEGQRSDHGPPPPSPPASVEVGEETGDLDLDETMALQGGTENEDGDPEPEGEQTWMAISDDAPPPIGLSQRTQITPPRSARKSSADIQRSPSASISSSPAQQQPKLHRRQRSSTDSQVSASASPSASAGYFSIDHSLSNDSTKSYGNGDRNTTPVRTIVVTSPSPPAMSASAFAALPSQHHQQGNVNAEASSSSTQNYSQNMSPSPVTLNLDGSGYLQLPPNSSISSTSPTPAGGRPMRRNTTGSTPSPGQGTATTKQKMLAATSSSHSYHPHLHLRHGKGISQPQMGFDDTSMGTSTSILGEGGIELASDIELHAERIRKERMEKRARAARDKEKEKEREQTERMLTRREREAYSEGEGDREGDAQVNLGMGPDGHGVSQTYGHGHSQPGAEGRVGRGESLGREKEPDMPLVGNLIGEGHVNYVLMYNMLTGIRIGVSRCQAKIKRPLTPEDFKGRHKFSFDIVGNELTPSAKYDFKFKDYAPWVFRYLREDIFALDPADYLLSLTAKYILSELGSPGKSGSFFYFSRDYRFIIKTIRHSEHKFLLSILERYYEHVQKNPHTLLSRFYGLHRVKLPRGRKIHFVIMNNLFPAHKDIHETYDLKGSTVGREYPEEKARKNPRAVLKDMNWINRGNRLELGPEKAALLTEQLRRDEEFLKSVQVMDYSLLVGIHNMGRGNRENLRRNTLKVFSPNLPETSRRSKLSQAGPKSPEAIAMRRAMRSSDPKRLGTGANTLHLPEDDTGDHRHQFVFYQDDGGLKATDDGNEPMGVVYYLGVIDILTPYGCVKRMEHVWKGMSADRHKISPVPPVEYGNRFFAFMKAIMRGGEGLEKFVVKEKGKERDRVTEKEENGVKPMDGRSLEDGTMIMNENEREKHE